jgi:adenylosuccinate lyase
MLDRYTRPEFKKLWSEQRKKETWLEVELAFLAARVRTGGLKQDAYDAIKANSKLNLERMDKFEAEYKHDMIAFVKDVQASLEEAGVGQYASEVHKLLTSYDVEDPAMVRLLRQAVQMDIGALENLRKALRAKAIEHKWTLMIHRTHGQFAEPGTFGHLLLVFAEAVKRSIKRLWFVMENELSEGKISGAVGNYPGMDPMLEEITLQYLGLKPAIAETQILQRDRFAAVVSAVALAAATIEQISRTFWEMMRSDDGELQEPRGSKQRGSSRMPYKKNPINIEQLQGLPRLLRGHLIAAMENVATPECRDISQSCVERHILPDATALLDFMAAKLTKIVQDLVVFPDRMQENLDRTYGTWAAQPIRDALMETGISYDDAYEYLQTCGFEAVEKRISLLNVVSEVGISKAGSLTAKDILGIDRLRSFFDARAYIEKGTKYTFRNEVESDGSST